VDLNDGTSARACAPRPGPVQESDGWPVREYTRRVGYLQEVLTRAHLGYTSVAVTREVGDDAYAIVRGVLWDLLEATRVVALNSGIWAMDGGAAGFLAGGLGPALGAAATTVGGRPIGEGLLAWLGLGVLVAPLHEHFEELGVLFERAIRRGWQSQGDAAALEAAAWELGETVAVFVRLVLQGLVEFLDGSTGKGGQGVDRALGLLRDSRLFQHCRRLGPWLVENLPKLQARFGKQSGQVARPTVPGAEPFGRGGGTAWRPGHKTARFNGG
jgi:hypothetical protein